MDQLPEELWLHIGEYLSYASLISLSECSKHWYFATSCSDLWRRLFHIHFSLEWLPSEASHQNLHWKSAFFKNLLEAKKITNKSIDLGSSVVCVSSPRGKIIACGKVTQILEGSPFLKYRVQIYNIFGIKFQLIMINVEDTEQVAVPTNKFITCPRHLVDTLINAPRRASTAFMFFASQNRKKIISQNSDRRYTEHNKLIAEAWSKLNSDEKSKYLKMAKIDNEQCNYDNTIYRYLSLVNKASSH